MGMFERATREQAKARIALIGPSGSGKTFTALRFASAMGQRVAVIDTERGSASKYAAPSGREAREGEFVFDRCELHDFSPQGYIAAIQAAATEGYDVLVIDSLSHAWSGPGGVLEMVDNKKAASRSADGFGAWRTVTPQHNALVDTILQAPLHIIATMRSKTEYVVEKGPDGKSSIRKVGLQPVQRDGMEYEFDIIADMDQDHQFVVSKTRCSALSDKVILKPGAETAKIIVDWLSDGDEARPTPVPQFVQDTPPTEPPQPSPPFADEISTRIKALQRHIADEYGLPADSIVAATTALRNEITAGRATKLADLTEPEADQLAEALHHWAEDQANRALEGAQQMEHDAAMAEAMQ